MDLNEIIRILSDIRSGYNCFDPAEEERYRGLSEAIKVLSAQTDLQSNLQPTCNQLATEQPDVPDKNVGDLISRQAAIDAIEDMQMPIMRSELTKEQFVFTGMSEALRAIKNLPSAQRWIPCSERLPEDSMRKQVQLDNGWIITAYFEEEQWYSIPEIYDRQDDLYISLEGAGYNVLAWMPLPEPYKEKS